MGVLSLDAHFLSLTWESFNFLLEVELGFLGSFCDREFEWGAHEDSDTKVIGNHMTAPTGQVARRAVGKYTETLKALHSSAILHKPFDFSEPWLLFVQKKVRCDPSGPGAKRINISVNPAAAGMGPGTCLGSEETFWKHAIKDWASNDVKTCSFSGGQGGDGVYG